MHELVLTRKLESNQGTFGSLSGAGLFLYTAELPWRGNRSGLSRIPAGAYRGRHYSSGKFPDCYEILDVPGREKILIHAGNWAGDIKAGLRSDVQGCILVGLETGELRGQKALLSSGAAMQKLRSWLGREPFCLQIREAFPGPLGREPQRASQYCPGAAQGSAVPEGGNRSGPAGRAERAGWAERANPAQMADPAADFVNAAAAEYEAFINPAHSSELAWLPDFGDAGGNAWPGLDLPGGWRRGRESSAYERSWL